jgi:hypothetical protein
MGVAPHGREGIFTALASAPLFAAMLPTGMISGALLQAYCPDHGQCTEAGAADSPGRRLLSALAGRGLGGGGGGSTSAAPGGYECDGRALWTIVALITLSSPLAVLLTQARSGSPVVLARKRAAAAHCSMNPGAHRVGQLPAEVPASGG